MSAQIAPDVIDYFIDHLDKIGPCNKISLVLYTRGGDTSAARNIVNLLRMYCDILQVIVPHKAHSSGTIISLGANEVVMTKQATLGPIDPSLHTALNPQVPDDMMILTFSTGEQRLFDATILTGEAFAPLSDENIFKNYKVVAGVVTWLDEEIDCAPEYMYTNSYEYPSLKSVV